MMTVWPSALLTLTTISIHAAYLLCRSHPVQLFWEASQWLCMLSCAACISLAIISRGNAVALFNAAASSASSYSLLIMSQFVATVMASEHDLEKMEVWWAAGRCLAGLAGGLSALSKAEEEAERERFNRQFASKFFCADSAFIL